MTEMENQRDDLNIHLIKFYNSKLIDDVIGT